MKRAIPYLFAIAALSAALQPMTASAAEKWIFVIIAFASGAPVGTQIVGADSKVQCVQAQEDAKKQLTDSADVQFAMTKCVPVTVPLVPKAKAEANS